MKKAKTILIVLGLLFAVIQATAIQTTAMQTETQTEAETKTSIIELNENDLYARAAVLMDADSGRVLYEKNGYEQMPMASTTKIMTCIVTLEQANQEELVTVSDYAASMPKVHLGMRSGEQYVLNDLLYSLMLESHNDTAVAIAEHVAGSVEAFAEMMNEKAKEIGCEHTYYITPNGLDATDTNVHSMTAADLARVMAYCIKGSPKSEEFRMITRRADYNFNNKITKEDGTVTNGNRSFSCHNHNSFLGMMEGALSGKTGFTNDAGYCYVGALERDNRTYTVALLACGWPNNKSYKWSDTKKLMNYGLENFCYQSFDEIRIDEEELKPIAVINGQTDRIGGAAYASVELQEQENVNDSDGADTHPKTEDGLLLRLDEEISVIYGVVKETGAPVHKGEKVGSIKYMIGENVWREEDVILTGSVKAIDFEWCAKAVLRFFLFSGYLA